RLVIFSIYRCSCVTTLFPYTTLFRSDANVLTGRLSGKNFDYDVDLKLVENKIKEKIAEPFNMTPEEAALGILRIANSNMLNALKDRKSTRLNSSHVSISYAVFCLKKK